MRADPPLIRIFSHVLRLSLTDWYILNKTAGRSSDLKSSRNLYMLFNKSSPNPIYILLKWQLAIIRRNRKMKKNRSRTKQIWSRTVSQVFFFVLIALIAINHAMDGTVIPLLPNTSLHAVCPFGSVVSLHQFATVGTFTQKIHESSFILMILVFILSFLFGSVFCGWVCPLGSAQEWVGKLGKRHSRNATINSSLAGLISTCATCATLCLHGCFS